MAERVPITSDGTVTESGGEIHWERLAWRYEKPLQRFFANRISNPADVNDLVQKVFLRVIQRARGGPIEHIQGYLFQVASSVLKDEYRRAHVRHQDEHEYYDEDAHGLPDEISPERVLLGEEAVMRVAEAVKQLPEATRDVYVLRVHRECEYAEIAERLGISLRGAQRHMARALKYLEEVLEQDLPLNDAPPERSN